MTTNRLFRLVSLALYATRLAQRRCVKEGRWLRLPARLCLVGVVGVLSVLAVAGGTSAAPFGIPVTLSVKGAAVGQVTREPGQAVTLIAKTAKLPAGDRILIQGERPSEAKPFKIKECSSPTCSRDWTQQEAGRVSFQALVVRHGAAGKVTVFGRSKPVPVVWRAAPPPPPPPPPTPALHAAPGHYCGFTDQGKSICFDVTSDGSAIANFSTQSIVTCSDAHQWLWSLSVSGTASAIQPDLTFSYSYTGPVNGLNSSQTNINETYSLSGTFDTAGNASGALALTQISWDSEGAHHDCNSAPYGWNAKLGA